MTDAQALRRLKKPRPRFRKKVSTQTLLEEHLQARNKLSKELEKMLDVQEKHKE